MPAFSDLGPGAGSGDESGAVATNAPAPMVTAKAPAASTGPGATSAPAPAAAAGGIAASKDSGKTAGDQPEPVVLREGDIVRLTFPGAPNLNTLAAIRRDGKTSLPLVGEVQAAGLKPSELETELIKLYGPQLQVKEVSVALETSAIPIYVNGSVLRPGKILSDRPITPLEAIMEAGGFDHTKANLKKVTVIRHGPNGQLEYHTLNLKLVLQGKQIEPFLLKAADIVYVPERFSWF
jgi:polysaccharide export outer membrane protein